MVDAARYVTVSWYSSYNLIIQPFLIFFKRQQLQGNHDQNTDVFKKNSKNEIAASNLRNAFSDLGNKIRNDGTASTQFVRNFKNVKNSSCCDISIFSGVQMSKKDGMLALANKKAVKLEDQKLMKELNKQSFILPEVINIFKPAQFLNNFFFILKNQNNKAAIKHEFILLPNIINAQTGKVQMHVENDAKPMETSKMDISEQHDDIEIEINEDEEDLIEDEHMKSTHVVDIDENDFDNPQFLAEYVKDIYAYLSQLEVCFHN